MAKIASMLTVGMFLLWGALPLAAAPGASHAHDRGHMGVVNSPSAHCPTDACAPQSAACALACTALTAGTPPAPFATPAANVPAIRPARPEPSAFCAGLTPPPEPFPPRPYAFL